MTLQTSSPKTVLPGASRASHDTSSGIGARLLYRDGLMLIIDKPRQLAVHRGPKGGISVEDYFDELRFGLPRMPALAHRLDRDTSGCLVLGRHRKALASLGKLFKNGAVGKTYWAVVEGEPAQSEGTIDMALGRLDASRGWWMKPDPNGQPAVSNWRVRGTNGDKTWLELEPVTGRTHQLRVHCAEMGWPILGDPIYGRATRDGNAILHLQSRSIVVPLYKNREPVRVTAPVPPHMRDLLLACGWDGVEITTPQDGGRHDPPESHPEDDPAPPARRDAPA